MSDVIIKESYLEDIADAIRDRNGETTTYKPRKMDEAIKNLTVVRPAKWVRPSDWPDYSKVDLTGQEVIYLTYDCTYNDRWISINVSGNYTVQRGSLSNGVFTAVSTTNVATNTTFQEALPTNEGNYVVYKITPQTNEHITSFKFASRTEPYSSVVVYGVHQPCLERYCRIPQHIGIFTNSNVTGNAWSTMTLTADTVMEAKPNGSCVSSYNPNGGFTLLEYLDLSTCSFANVTNLTSFLSGQYNLAEVYLPHDVSNKCTTFNTMFANDEHIVCLDLTGWDTSGGTTFNQMFYHCYKLCEIKGIEDFDFSSATNIASMFDSDRCIDFDTSDWVTTSALTTCEKMFYCCNNLKSVDLSGFVTTNVTTFANMFYGCRCLKEINLSTFTISDKTTSLAGMFLYCGNLSRLTRIKNWNTSNVTTFEAMFQECRSLKEIDISDFVFSKATTVRNMFNGCSHVKKIKATMNLPLVTTGATAAGVFQGCIYLDDISQLTFTNYIYMPNYRTCRSLTYINAPSSVTTIRDYALADLTHCRVIDFRNHSAVPTLAAAGDINTGINAMLKIVVPDALYSTWIAATNWSNATIKNKIISVTDYTASLSS